MRGQTVRFGGAHFAIECLAGSPVGGLFFKATSFQMSHVTYKIVQHDGNWAYTVDGVFSEPFANHAMALAAARRAAAEQRVP